MFEVIAAKKEKLVDEDAVRSAVAKLRPEAKIENIADKGADGWLIRLRTADGPPPFLKEKKDAPDDEATESPEEEAAEDSGEKPDDDAASKDKDKSDKGKKGDPVAEVKSVIDQLTNLFTDLGGKVDELQQAHDEKAQKLDEISDTVGDGEGMPPKGDFPPKPPVPEDLGPTPGAKPPMAPPRPGAPPTGRRPMMPPGQVNTFTKRKTEVVTHSGLDEKGERISLVAAAASLEGDPEFTDYEVVGMTENPDGSYSAKLKLKS